MNLRSDPLLDELHRLSPEISVRGGSFAHWLPHPKSVPSADHNTISGRARREATEKCLTELLRNAGLPAIEPGHLPSGARDWPQGYTGSISHKGTKVAAALTRVGRVKSIGIDIETLDRGRELLDIEGLGVSDELPPTLGEESSVVLLSAKEAVFKALNPVLGIPFGYEEVRISWNEVVPQELRGVAHCHRVVLDIRCSIAVPSWVGSVALLWQQTR